MSRSFHVIGAVFPVVAVLLIGTGPASAQSVVYQGFTHTPVGAAMLRVDPSRNVLEVSALGPAGEDGVAVTTTKTATSWTAAVRTPVVNGLPVRLSWHAIADGRRIGSGRSAAQRPYGGTTPANWPPHPPRRWGGARRFDLGMHSSTWPPIAKR